MSMPSADPQSACTVYACELFGVLDERRLTSALSAMIDRYPVLHPGADRPPSLLAAGGSWGGSSAIDRVIDAAATGRPPYLRVAVTPLAHRRWVVAIALSASVGDVAFARTLLSELASLYSGRCPDVRPQPISGENDALVHRVDGTEPADPLRHPGRPRRRTVKAQVPPTVLTAVARLAERAAVTPADVGLATFAAYLNRQGSQSSLPITCELPGRRVTIHVAVGPAATLDNLVKAVADQRLSGVAGRITPYPARTRSSVAFAMRSDADQTHIRWDSLQLTRLALVQSGSPHADLLMRPDETDPSTVVAEFDPAVFDEGTIRQTTGMWLLFTERAVHAPTTPISKIVGWDERRFVWPQSGDASRPQAHRAQHHSSNAPYLCQQSSSSPLPGAPARLCSHRRC